MKFFKPKYYGGHGFIGRRASEWAKAIADYQEHLAAVLPRLPESAIAFISHEKRWPLHDAVVEFILMPRQGQLNLELDDRTLEFLGVRRSSYPKDLKKEPVWLHTEIDKAPGGTFELRALWDVGELSVIAEEIRVFAKHERRYVVPDEVSPVPDLFLDRSRGKRKGRR